MGQAVVQILLCDPIGSVACSLLGWTLTNRTTLGMTNLLQKMIDQSKSDLKWYYQKKVYNLWLRQAVIFFENRTSFT